MSKLHLPTSFVCHWGHLARQTIYFQTHSCFQPAQLTPIIWENQTQRVTNMTYLWKSTLVNIVARCKYPFTLLFGVCYSISKLPLLFWVSIFLIVIELEVTIWFKVDTSSFYSFRTLLDPPTLLTMHERMSYVWTPSKYFGFSCS